MEALKITNYFLWGIIFFWLRREFSCKEKRDNSEKIPDDNNAQITFSSLVIPLSFLASISIHCQRCHQLNDVNDHKCQRKIIIIICWCNFNYGLCWCQLKQRYSKASSREYFMSILIYCSHYLYHHKHNDNSILISVLHKIYSLHNNYYCNIKLAHYFQPPL